MHRCAAATRRWGPTAEVIQSPRIPHRALAGDPRAKAMIVGVHGKKGEKEIAGHGRIHFVRVSMSTRLAGPSGGMLGSSTFSRNHSTFRDHQGRTLRMPRVTA